MSEGVQSDIIVFGHDTLLSGENIIIASNLRSLHTTPLARVAPP